MKKGLIWVAVISLALTLSACNKDRTVLCNSPLYDIYIEDGHYYIKFNEAIVDDNDESIYSPMSPPPHFSSVEEMRRKILAGELSREDLECIYLWALWKNGVYEIYDLSRLVDAYTPDDTRIKSVYWSGNNYDFVLESVVFEIGSLEVCTEERYNRSFSEEYTNFPDEYQTVHSKTNVADRNAVEILYSNDTGRYKIIRYTLSDETRTLYIQEDYCLEHVYDKDWPSETVPNEISIYGVEDGVWYEAGFHHLTERPSVEWLSSFGVTPLK